MKFKTCRKCKACMPISDMVNDRDMICKECNRKYQREYYHRKYAGNKKHIRDGHLRVRFGISPEEYNRLYDLQLGGCAICKQPCSTGRRLGVDHNHDTNENRGLLCNICNAGIGHFKEDEDLLLSAIEYLKRTTWNKKIA